MNSTVRYIARLRHSPRMSAVEIRNEEWAIIRGHLIDVVYAKTADRCFYCGDKQGKSRNVDHFHPQAKGGGDEATNLVPVCRPCNSSKGSFTIEEWRFSRRLKIAREAYGVPAIPRAAIEWLFSKGVDVLEGVPDIEFWFEAEGFPAPVTSSPVPTPEWVKEAARERIRSRKIEMERHHIEEEAARQGVSFDDVSHQVDLAATAQGLLTARSALPTHGSAA